MGLSRTPPRARSCSPPLRLPPPSSPPCFPSQLVSPRATYASAVQLPPHYFEADIFATSGLDLIRLAKADPAFCGWKYADQPAPQHKKMVDNIRLEFSELARQAGKWRGGVPGPPAGAAGPAPPAPLVLPPPPTLPDLQLPAVPAMPPVLEEGELSTLGAKQLYGLVSNLSGHVAALQATILDQHKTIQGFHLLLQQLAQGQCQQQLPACAAVVDTASVERTAMAVAERVLAPTRTQLAGLQAHVQQAASRSEQLQREALQFDMLLRNTSVTPDSLPAEAAALAISALSPVLGTAAAQAVVAKCSVLVSQRASGRAGGRQLPASGQRVDILVRAADKLTHRELIKAARGLRELPDPAPAGSGSGGGGRGSKVALARVLTPKQQELMARLIPHMVKARTDGGALWNIDYRTMRLFVTPAGGRGAKPTVIDANNLSAPGVG